VASPERPTGLVEGDRYDTSVAAEVIMVKTAITSRPIASKIILVTVHGSESLMQDVVVDF
jgi:hypothetical protein